jgi:hypothetical protein
MTTECLSFSSTIVYFIGAGYIVANLSYWYRRYDSLRSENLCNTAKDEGKKISASYKNTKHMYIKMAVS